MKQNGNAEYLSVKEVADIIGCSVQAVYNRLEKDFKPYLKIENNKKWLNRKVLELIEKPSDSSDFNKSFKDVLNLLERQNEQLSKELEVKNEQIRELNARLAESNAALVTAQQTAAAAQALHAGTIQQQLITDGNATDEDKPTFKDRLKCLFKGER